MKDCSFWEKGPCAGMLQPILGGPGGCKFLCCTPCSCDGCLPGGMWGLALRSGLCQPGWRLFRAGLLLVSPSDTVPLLGLSPHLEISFLPLTVMGILWLYHSEWGSHPPVRFGNPSPDCPWPEGDGDQPKTSLPSSVLCGAAASGAGTKLKGLGNQARD